MRSSKPTSESFVRSLWTAFGEPKLREWVESRGMKLGPWKPHGNIVDHFEEQQFNDMQNEIMRTAASNDPEPIKILKGYSTMMGREWGPAQQQQAETIRGGLGEAAPVLMRWAPEWWDEMHGGVGSVASLASAIGDAHRFDKDMTAEKAVQMAEGMAGDLLGDPTKTQGLSLREIGYAYREGATRGYVSLGTDLDTQLKDLTPMLGAVAAVRDTLGPEGYDTSDIAGMFAALDTIAPNAHYDFDRANTDIRKGLYLSRRGGAYGAAMDIAGVTIPQGGTGVNRDELNQQHRQLTEQAGTSEIGNMVLATARAAHSGLIESGSQAQDFLNKAMEGELDHFESEDWRKMMARSGMTATSAMLLADQRGENQMFAQTNPQYRKAIDAVRANQPKFDFARPFNAIERQNVGEHPEVVRGAKSEYTRSKGYRGGMGHYNQLHGPAVQGISGVMAQADNRAQLARGSAHIGQKGVFPRSIDIIKDGPTSPAEAGKKFLGAIPDTIPQIKTAARGLPDMNDFGDPGQLGVNELTDMFIQRHKAQRAGEHLDYRLGNKDLGLLSWSMKPTHMPKPGEKRFVRQQPVHSYNYGNFQGTIGSGYGKGEVRREQRGKVLITKATPTKIEYTVATTGSPERFVLMRPEKWGDREWLLINVTPHKKEPYDKTRYKKLPAEAVEPYIEQMQAGTSVQAKLDGASSLVKVMKGGAEILSYRTSKRTGNPIVHTERMFGGRPKYDIPKEYEGTVMKGELYAQPKGDANAPPASPMALGGLLNSTIEHSRQKQQDRGLDIKNMLYDIQQLGKRKIDPDVTPYAERRKMMEEVLPFLPKDKFHMSEESTNPEDAKALWRQITEGQHPLTREGVVIQPPTGKPIKAKQLEESDVHITDIFPGKGKYRGTAAGGFGYALNADGPRVGEVGTGLSDELRTQLHTDPASYIGRRARIRSQEQHPSGAWRSPALIALHEDY